MDDNGEPCLADFGLSRLEAGLMAEPPSLVNAGSFRWKAPELLFPRDYGGTGERTTASDMYAFGMTCLEVSLELA